MKMGKIEKEKERKRNESRYEYVKEMAQKGMGGRETQRVAVKSLAEIPPPVSFERKTCIRIGKAFRRIEIRDVADSESMCNARKPDGVEVGVVL